MDATVTSKGQVTIPKPIRETLGLEPGDKVSFVPNDSGDIVLSRQHQTTIDDLIGCLAHLADGPPLSTPERRALIGEMLAEDDERIRREASE